MHLAMRVAAAACIFTASMPGRTGKRWRLTGVANFSARLCRYGKANARMSARHAHEAAMPAARLAHYMLHNTMYSFPGALCMWHGGGGYDGFAM